MSGLGCYIRLVFVGALYYADDMKLLSPIRKGWQKMIDIYKEFGIEFYYDIVTQWGVYISI